jgi:hypothetical protein
VAFLRQVVRRSRLRSKKAVLAFAESCAGERGVIVQSGPIVFWSTGKVDPLPTLTEQSDIVWGRFASRLGGSFPLRLPLCVLSFDTREALVNYHRPALGQLWPIDGAYVPGPLPTIALSTEVLAYRVGDLERTTRSLFAYYLLHDSKGFFPPQWLALGIANSLASGANGDELANLNRRMVASISRGTALDSANLFLLKPNRIRKLLAGWHESAKFQTLAQFSTESWSVVEYLSGPRAPRDRKERFRAFVEELGKNSAGEAMFERHFGYGFEALLDGWKASVLAQGIGAYGPPPARTRDALVGRILPLIRDPQAIFRERVMAIREVGQAGYVLGAGALLDLLREGDEIPREEVFWALESISGLTFGDDPARWSAWFVGLPAEAVNETASAVDRDPMVVCPTPTLRM